MHVLIGRLEIHVPHSRSLKEKRSVVRRIRGRIREHFEISCSEVGFQDLHQRAALGVAAVGPERDPLEKLWPRIVELAETSFDGELLEEDHELLSYAEGKR